MAVYTDVPDEALEAFLEPYELGDVQAFKGIAEGVENSNYLLKTQKGTFILTLYEKRVNEADLPFFMSLLDHLALKGLTCPRPVADRSGVIINPLMGKKAALVTFLEGLSHHRPNVHHCGELGRILARLHQAGHDFPLRRPNALGPQSWFVLAQQARERADIAYPGLMARIDEALSRLGSWPDGERGELPSGIIHADLFPDNVFFLGPSLSGVIDFYFACTDIWAYDIAICLNAWCFENDGSFNHTKGQALLSGYQSVRPMEAQEISALPLLCQGAALRFLLTRLIDGLNKPEGALVRPKDPLEYDRKLAFHKKVRTSFEYGLSV